MSASTTTTQTVSEPITGTALPFPLYARGKVRDVYELPDDRLLLVATDRLSAFDHVLPTPIPDKGRILTQLSAFWFDRTANLVPNHLLSLDPWTVAAGADGQWADAVAGRAMVARRARRIDAECVVRGYLAGSAWEEYRAAGSVAGITLPPGLESGSPLPDTLFTPATKATVGHDENITFSDLADRIGAHLAVRLRDLSITLYRSAHAHAAACGLILADTKFEFGHAPDGTLILIDEALTPDASRYWDAGAYSRGERVQFDKQFVRDYLTEIHWDREPPAPSLPPDIVAATADRYREVYRRLTQRELN